MRSPRTSAAGVQNAATPRIIRGGRTRCQRIEVDGFGALFVASRLGCAAFAAHLLDGRNLGVGATGLRALAAKIGGAYFDGAAHFEESRAHAAADALFEGVFA